MSKVGKSIEDSRCSQCIKDQQKSCLPKVLKWPGQRCDRCEKNDSQCFRNQIGNRQLKRKRFGRDDSILGTLESAYYTEDAPTDGNYDLEQPMINSAIDGYRLEAKISNNRTIHYSHSSESVVTEWEHIREIGQGGFATVFLQQEVGGEKRRAVKRIYRPKSRNFRRELDALIQAGDRNDLFVEFFNWYVDVPGDFIFIAMEYLEGGDLKQYMQKNPAEAKRNAKTITQQLLEGLAVLHEKGIIHRDLKPQNVLIASTSPITIKLTDFGVSRRIAEGRNMTITGTPAYMAPEMRGLLPPLFTPCKSYTFAVDVWGLGCIIYELLTSEKPFQDSDQSKYTTSGLLKDFCSAKIDFPIKRFQSHASNRAIHFVEGFLVADPSSRIMVADALDLLWLLDFPDDAFQDGGVGVTRHQFMSLALDLKLKNAGRLILACKKSSYEGEIDLVLSSSTEHDISVLLHAAAFRGYTSVVKRLANYTTDTAINNELSEGEGPRRTALQAAAGCGHIEVVEILISNSADVNASPSKENGRTALQAAAGSGHIKVVELLILNNADVNASGCKENGRTALQAAAEGGHIEVVQLLISNNADVNALPCREKGRTALQAAAERCHIEVVELLISDSADVNAKPCEIYGRTALQAAAEGGHIKVVELLISNNADVNAKPCEVYGQTALKAAVEGGHIGVKELLISNGADIRDLSTLEAVRRSYTEALFEKRCKGSYMWRSYWTGRNPFHSPKLSRNSKRIKKTSD